jgi:hypothetical protein
VLRFSYSHISFFICIAPREVNALLRWFVVLIGLVAAAPAAAKTRLLMLDQPACEWCARWDAEVGPIYARTAEGRQAPLLRTGIHGPLPAGVMLARRAVYTPTFVLIVDGAEVGRIEGYPGEAFFYGLLQQLLQQSGAPNG